MTTALLLTCANTRSATLSIAESYYSSTLLDTARNHVPHTATEWCVAAVPAPYSSRTAPRALLTRPQLPLGLLTAATGHPMLVELKSGETLNGLLVNCDTWMNLTLREVVQTSADGDKFMRLPEIYVRGSTVSIHCRLSAYGRKLTVRRSSTCGCPMRSSRSSRSSRPRTRRKEADVAVCTREETTGATGEAGARAVVGGAVEGAAVVTTTLERATRGGFVERDETSVVVDEKKRRRVGWRMTQRRDAVTIRLVDDRLCIQMNTIDTPGKLWSH